MRKRRPLYITAAALGTMVVVLIGAMFTMETRWFSDFLSERLSKRIGQQVDWAGPLQIDWSLRPIVRVEQFQIDNPEWAKHDALTHIDSITARLNIPQLFQGLLAIDFLRLEHPTAHLMRSPEHGSNWAFLKSDKKKKEPLLKPRLKELLISRGELTYLDVAANTRVAVTISSPNGDTLRIHGDGRIRGEPFELLLAGDPPQEVVDRVVTEGEPKGDYMLAGSIKWQDHRLQLEGTTGSLTELAQLQLNVQLQGPNAAELSELLNMDAYAAPYGLQARVQHYQQTWSVRELEGHMGESEFEGQMTYKAGEPRPKLLADLQISSLNLDRMSIGGRDNATASAAIAPQATAQRKPWKHMLSNGLTPIQNYEAEVELDIGQLQKQQVTVQNLHADVKLEDGKLSIEPLSFETGDGQAVLTAQINAAQKWPKGSALLKLQGVDIGLALAGLGYDNLGTIDGQLKAELDKKSLSIVDSRLHYLDRQTATDVIVEIDSRKTATGARGVAVNARGQVNGSEAELDLTGGPLLDIDDPNKPYPLKANLTVADTTVNAKGTITQPLRMKDVDMNVLAEGPDPVQLNQLTGLNLPHLPPYKAKGHLLREDESWYLRDIRSQVGDSDLSGNIRWDTQGREQSMVWADLYSKKLDVDGLTSANDSQLSNDITDADGSEQVIPEEEFESKQLQGFGGRIKYRAAEVVASGVPLDDLKLDLQLDNGQLELTPLSFGVGRGTVRLELWADTTVKPVGGHANIELSRVGLNDLLAPFELADESYGRLGGRGEFNFSGASLSQALANLQGEMQLAMTNGRLDATLIEAAGLDAGELLFGLFGDDPDPVSIQCAYVDLDANSGIVDLRSFTIATSDSNILGDGTVNLQKEEFELVIEAHPKDFSILSGSSPIRFHGSFSNPRIDAVSDELIGRGVLAAIGAAVFPPAALLPLVELGETEGQGGCRQALASADPVTAQ